MEGLLALRSLVGASGSGGAGSQGAKGVKEDTGALGPKGETGPHITDKKIDMDSLLPQTLKSRFLIPDYDNSDNNEMWLTGNMFTVKLKTYQKVLIYKGIRWLM